MLLLLRAAALGRVDKLMRVLRIEAHSRSERSTLRMRDIYSALGVTILKLFLVLLSLTFQVLLNLFHTLLHLLISSTY